MILFCLPYAGGTASIYYKWQEFLNSSIELKRIELKGRGSRYNEAFYETLDEAVDDIFEDIKDMIIAHEYAIYGHSMGSILAYELYYKIKEQNFRTPKHIFFSGHRSPNCIREKENIYKLPHNDFMKKLVDLGGTQEEILKNKELLQLIIPIIKNDFKILENYIYKDMEDKIECDISVLNGDQEKITLEETLAWKSKTGKGFKVYEFEGDHFFINNNIANIVNVVNLALIE